MNQQFGSPFNNNMFLTPQEEEQKRRVAQAKHQALAMARASVAPVAPVAPVVHLGQTQTDPWGQGGTCMGLKILCGVFGLIVVVLVVILIIKLVHHKGAQTSVSSAGDSQLPMSLQGGFDFGNESLMSTS
jgi:uncharacterized membrane protein